MAIDTTDQIVQARVRNSLLKIAGKGGSPGQPYDDPEKGKGPFVPAPKRLASTQIRPNQIMLPFVPKDAETDEQYGDGVDEVELKGLQAHSPSGTYDDYGSPLKIAPYKGGNPSGQQIEIPWMKEEYKKKHPELEKLHNEKYHPLQISRSRKDKLIPMIMEKYGKNLQGDYKDKEQLLKNLLMIGNLQAMNLGPSTPIKNYGGNMGYKQNYGAGRVTNIRPKGSLSLADVLKSIQCIRGDLNLHHRLGQFTL